MQSWGDLAPLVALLLSFPLALPRAPEAVLPWVCHHFFPFLIWRTKNTLFLGFGQCRIQDQNCVKTIYTTEKEQHAGYTIFWLQWSWTCKTCKKTFFITLGLKNAKRALQWCLQPPQSQWALFFFSPFSLWFLHKAFFPLTSSIFQSLTSKLTINLKLGKLSSIDFLHKM